MSPAARTAALCLAALLTLVRANTARAFDYDEALHGDLSGDPEAPTPLGVLPVGSHTLQAAFVRNDYDLVTFTIAPGTRLDSILLDRYAGSTVSFSGLQAGPTWTADLGVDVNPAPLLGWVLFGENTIGMNLLDDYALAAGAIGFTPPLPPGTYTLELQETGPFPVDAAFTLNVVPEPSALAIAALGVAALLAHRRLRRASVLVSRSSKRRR